MKKIVPGTLIVFGQLMVALLFLVFLFSKADNKYQEVVVLENNNLNKTEDVISGLFVVNTLLQNKTEKDEELVDLISNKDSDFKTIEHKKDILFAITTARFYCLLLKYEGQYMLVCEKNDGTQYQRRFKNKDDLGFYISRKFLQEHGEIFI